MRFAPVGFKCEALIQLILAPLLLGAPTIRIKLKLNAYAYELSVLILALFF